MPRAPSGRARARPIGQSRPGGPRGDGCNGNDNDNGNDNGNDNRNRNRNSVDTQRTQRT